MDTIDRAADSLAYQRAVDALRARGCRCPLRWDTSVQRAIPATGCDRHADRSTCALALEPTESLPCSDAEPPPTV